MTYALNKRSRKTLGWKTPAEAFEEQLCSLQHTGMLHRPIELTQYLSQDFAAAVKSCGLHRFVGRTSVRYDNAQAETSNAVVEVERVNRTYYPTREHARNDVTLYIELHYDRKRLHSGLSYRTPAEAYNEYLNSSNAA